ncbi:hypothetical protein [Solemya velesiana gill symbiont]|uniref:hypothetical protein n=1 Tax=Solemya velesiana gill symbiont TaxID=1918948 RepID=UPI001FE29352|nr:hypothetical protein [Solemya velesiana gill symbiont]
METQDQADFLKRHGCDVAQGYLYAKPMNIEQIADRFFNRDGTESLPGDDPIPSDV